MRSEIERFEPEADLDRPAHLSKSSLREPACPAAEATFIYGVEMTQVDDRRPRQPGFLGGDTDSHRKPGHPEIARDGRHNRSG